MTLPISLAVFPQCYLIEEHTLLQYTCLHKYISHKYLNVSLFPCARYVNNYMLFTIEKHFHRESPRLFLNHFQMPTWVCVGSLLSQPSYSLPSSAVNTRGYKRNNNQRQNESSTLTQPSERQQIPANSRNHPPPGNTLQYVVTPVPCVCILFNVNSCSPSNFGLGRFLLTLNVVS